ncbi:LGALS4 [Mytilus edulis]|uniref:Galectin n=1 Tax=Mytilus edulis TaxID=6550 RepID=A0A8S3SL29_MYTED|nr:LGALS4 [Mytilus edulis]
MINRVYTPSSFYIPNGLHPGKQFIMRGRVTWGTEAFSINFGCDCENETCAFHFNPRPNEGVVIRNANLGGWGDEERDYEADFPFSPGQYFDALFVCTDDKYHTKYSISKGFNYGLPSQVSDTPDIKDMLYTTTVPVSIENTAFSCSLLYFPQNRVLQPPMLVLPQSRDIKVGSWKPRRRAQFI